MISFECSQFIKPQEPKYDKDGHIERICFRPKCNQPLWVREYSEYCLGRPLLCLTCWEYVYNTIDCIMAARDQPSHNDRMIVQKEVIGDLLKSLDICSRQYFENHNKAECEECITRKHCSDHCAT